ncbi:MAG: hypothetical protein IID32_04985 [Planctomycetes bacterium]|nr:hypothetical protein [Planctomycetota bacterium]
MNINESEFLISRYADEDLTEKEGQELQKLLDTQPQAKQIHSQYQQLDQHLAKLPSGIEQVDFNDFANRVRSGIDQAMHVQSPRRMRRWILIPLAAAAVLAFAFFGPLQSLWRHSPDPTNQIDKPGQVVIQPQPQDIQMPRVISVGLVRQTSLASVQSVVRISLTHPESGTDEMERVFLETKGEVICYASPAQPGPGDTSPENSEYDLNTFFF